MISTLITTENSGLFLPTVPDEVLSAGDVFLGAVDEDTDTACGVLAAEVVEGDIMAIRYLYVNKKWRMNGAAGKLLDMLTDIAHSAGAAEIICNAVRPCPDPSDSAEQTTGMPDDGMYEFLTGNGFEEIEELRTPLFEFNISDIKPNPNSVLLNMVSVSDVSEDIWKQISFASSLSSDDYIDDLSFVAFDNRKNYLGHILVRMDDNGLVIESLNAEGDHSSLTINSILERVYEVCKSLADEDVPVRVPAQSNSIQSLLMKITGSKAVKLGDHTLLSKMI
ncbi:MAG: GNAT family N-acetyltransferase [Lachnospiraceae bacterium]|nr:GNAT family N-acetyltransferase [Lachnospiraceae bacterium]